MNTRPISAGAVALACLAMLGCSARVATPPPAVPSHPDPQAGAPVATCAGTSHLRSYQPPSPLPEAGSLPDGSLLAAIAERGRLIVGVVADVRGMSSPATLSDAETGDDKAPGSVGQLEGFDIDLANDIARALMGDKAKVEIRVLTHSQALEELRWETVDLAIMNYAVTCGRWEKAAFSAPYLTTKQGLLTRRGESLGKNDKVCVVDGTPNREIKVEATFVGRPTVTQCLTAFQTGEVGGITDDNAVLAGLKGQDRYLRYPPVTPGAPEHSYGVATNKDRKDLVAFVNGVLAARVADGRWQRSYDRWLAPGMGAGTPPAPEYGR